MTAPRAAASDPCGMRAATASLILTSVLAGQAADDSAAATANPRVAPGLVRWHADLAGARRAAVDSRRPVLLFQLLGELDREFC